LDTLKIKLSIADRVYPLNISLDQEEALRKAAKHIEAMIKEFEKSYFVRDKQDVLAMCVLQYASQIEQKSIDKTDHDDLVKKRLSNLDKLLDLKLIS